MPSWALEMSTYRAGASSRGAEPPRTQEMQSIRCLELLYSPLVVAESIPLSSQQAVAVHRPTAPSFSAARREQPWEKRAGIKGEMWDLLRAE